MSLKIAISSYSGYGFWFALRFLEEGHLVNLHLSKPEYATVLKGIVPPPVIATGHGKDFWPNYSKYDLSLFDLTGRQHKAEHSTRQCPTIGDGAFNCQAEDDRHFGLAVMEEAGVKVPPYEKFTDIGAAKAHVSKSNKRFVYKPDGGQDNDTDTTYVSSSPEDMIGNLQKLFTRTNGSPFILQEFIQGTEVSVEGYFNGDDFYLVNVTLEEKKFMNDNKGPNTGCAGNLVFWLSEETELFRQGLGLMKPFLKQIGYRGMIDLNTIATPNGLYGLEWTPRLGYDASATLFHCYGGNLGEALHQIAIGKVPDQSYRYTFGAATRMSIPPYPTEVKGKHPAGIPIKGIKEEDIQSIYMYDAMLKGDTLQTAGMSGFVAVPLTGGSSIGEAWARQKLKVDEIKIPNAQYRTDLEKTTSKRYNELSLMGYL